jgi:putative addiction module antidote
MVKLTLRKIGNSVGAIIPQEVLAALNVDQGDVLYLVAAPDGYRITPYDPDFERQMEVARGVLAGTMIAAMKRRRNVLRGLAR